MNDDRHTKTDNSLTKDRIDALLRFIPVLYPENRPIEPFVAKNDGDQALPEYDQRVVTFFREAAHEWWMDHDYQSAAAAEMVGNDERIGLADCKDIRTLLTVCVRGERFCDGLWGGVVKQGRILAILNRLRALRDEM